MRHVVLSLEICFFRETCGSFVRDVVLSLFVRDVVLLFWDMWFFREMFFLEMFFREM